MKERLKTAIPLLIIVALAFALPGIYGSIFFMLLADAMLVYGCCESFDMMQIENRGKQQLCVCIYALLMVLAVYLQNLPLQITLTALYIMIAFLSIFRETPNKQNLLSVIIGLGIAMYICWNLLFMVRIYYMGGNCHSGRFLLLYMIACTKMADTGAYIVGSRTAKNMGGNHKLAPSISPQKSWEGLIGGTFFSVLTALILLPVPCMTDFCGKPVFGIFSAIIFGILASVIGLLGDLAESALKRAAGKKDSGTIPGIGGILDVLDSLIFVAPLYYAYVIAVLR